METKNEVMKPTTQHEKATKAIKAELAKVEKGYLNIVGKLQFLRDEKAFENYGCKSISEFAKKEFGMAKSTTSTLLTIADKFCENYILPQKCYELGFGKMAQLIRLDDVSEIDYEKVGTMSRAELKEEIDEIEENSTDEPKQKKASKKCSVKVSEEMFLKVLAIINEEFENVSEEVTTLTIIKE